MTEPREYKEFTVRTSERVDFTRCKQKWYWGYVDQIQPKKSAPALRFGSLVHEALAAYYTKGTTKSPTRRGIHPAKTFVKFYEAELEAQASEFNVRDAEDDKWVDARVLGVEMMNNYINHYGKDERYRVIAPEQAFQIDLFDDDGNYICTYVGQLDAVIQDLTNGEIGLMEHKTAASISTIHLNLDEQAGSYWALATPYLRGKGILKPGEDLSFILYNFLRKGKLDQRKKNAAGQSLNKDGSVSKSQPAPLFHRERVYRSQHDRDELIRRVAAQVEDMKAVLAGERPLYKTILGGCSGMFGCQFRDMCELHETGANWEELRDATMTVWDPYDAHTEHQEKGE